VPYYKGENTVFDVSPSSVRVSVKHQHVKVPQKFQVQYMDTHVADTNYLIFFMAFSKKDLILSVMEEKLFTISGLYFTEN
jgi:hypothetical protein